MNNNISEVIKNRRATPPKFLSKKEVSKELIQLLLENANWAPNHKNTEPWRFKVYTGESKQILSDEIYTSLIKKIESGESLNLQKVDKFKSSIENVPVAIAIIFERDSAERVPEWQEIAAISMAVQNMWLTATDLGLGAFWATPEFLPFLNDIVGIQPQQKLLGFFYVGHIALDYPSPGRGDIALKVEWRE
ncbi:MAG TPA: nitroreductase [Draconibacterium sp.]|nr:nitroreductase [Draconibacterium sp.]HRX12013.1 nitroreductase [Draconibacterium sp.]